MFTGLIQELGELTRIEPRGRSARVTVAAPGMAADLALGESVAVDGACLTVEASGDGRFEAFVSEETLSRTTLGQARPGRVVNLERALCLGDRLGGHLVAGHVDAVGAIRAVEPRDDGWWLAVAAPGEILAACVPKGSITVAGISLTLVDVEPDGFTVAVIPRTYQDTSLHARRAGDAVNLESDLIGKYVVRALGAYAPPQNAASGDAGLMDLLREGGFAR